MPATIRTPTQFFPPLSATDVTLVPERSAP